MSAAAAATLRYMPRIDTRRIVDDLEEIIEMLEEIDGVDVSDVEPSKKIKSNAELSRELLYIQHRLDKASVDVMSVYHENRRSR